MAKVSVVGFGSWLVPGICALVSACASAPTPYAPADGRYGYSSEELGQNLVEVRFRGNTQTSEEQVERALFRRMAEIAESRGAGHFTIVDQQTDCVTTLRTSQATTCTYRQSADALFQYNFGVYEVESPWHATPQREYEASARIYLSPSSDCGAAPDCHVTSEALALSDASEP